MPNIIEVTPDRTSEYDPITGEVEWSVDMRGGVSEDVSLAASLVQFFRSLAESIKRRGSPLPDGE